MSPSSPQLVLVTGATGFIGAHIVDQLLDRGIRVRGTTRSTAKGEAMLKARPQHAGSLDFVQIRDFGEISDAEGALPSGFDEAVQGVDGIIHTASPLTYTTTNNEKELILPAIAGTRAVLAAAATQPTIRRVVLTSSFAAIMDPARTSRPGPYFTYTAADWNPLTYAEAAAPTTSAVVAYRGAKKFAELAAWEFMRDHTNSNTNNKPLPFTLTTICPPLTFGPVAHPVSRADQLNESNATLWKAVSLATGITHTTATTTTNTTTDTTDTTNTTPNTTTTTTTITTTTTTTPAENPPLPKARVPFWADVRDVARAHIEALLRPAAGGRRFLVAAPERFTYALAARIVKEELAGAGGREVEVEEQVVDESHGVDGETAGRELGLEYRGLRESVVDLVVQVREMEGGGGVGR